MSVEILDLEISNKDKVVALRIDGAVDQMAMMQVLGLIGQVHQVHGKVRIYQEIENIGTIELDAIIEKIKFLFSSGLSVFERVVIVTDKSWLQKITALENKLLSTLGVAIDIKAFAKTDEAAALAYLQAE
tara:strand:- start:1012 stop:1401 length:390 start_codon:yes stop_codon:yes gene_type:complete